MKTALLILIPALVAPLAGHAEEPFLPHGMERAEVLDGWQTPSGARIAALRIALDKGWKTYWRSPGDAGIPPQFNFAASENVAGIEVRWPRPVVFDQNGMRSVGYADEVILPIEITPRDPSQPIALSAEMEFGICHDVCVPVSVEVSADLEGPGAPDPVISAALTDQPRPVALEARCDVEKIADGVRVTASIEMPEVAAEPVTLFELRSTPMWVSESVTRLDGATMVSMAEFVPDNAQPFDLDAGDLRITVLSGADAVEINGCVE